MASTQTDKTSVTYTISSAELITVCRSSVLDRLAPLRRFHDSGAGYKYPDFLTLLTCELLC